MNSLPNTSLCSIIFRSFKISPLFFFKYANTS
nr:MAG TPA: hypothetical protein [Caudoviricetes sp.]DAY23362.1 MAG TPA: hypothetical protein [Caudoviricetes sp.]